MQIRSDLISALPHEIQTRKSKYGDKKGTHVDDFLRNPI